MSTPRPHLLPSFDPGKAKIAELRGILLEHDVPYPSNAKKTDLVKLFEKHVRPQAATLLAQSSSVRPSTQGILDGDAESGSLHELDTDSEEERRFEAEQAAKRGKGRKSVRGRKSLSEAIAALEEDEDKGKTPKKQPSLAGKKGKGKAKEVEVEEDSEDELPPPKSAKKGRKSSRPERPSEDEEEEDELASMGAEEEEEPVRQVSPKKRKAQDTPGPGTPRLSALLQQQQDSPFSDFNPFQSGGEETPGRDVKRRKSSLGPAHLKERKSQTLAGRKSMPASSLSTTHNAASSSPDKAGDWAPSPPKKARKSELPTPPVPPLPASSFFAPPPGSSGFRSAPGSARKRPSEEVREVNEGRKGKERRSAPARVAVPEPEPEPESEEAEEEEEEEQEEEEDVDMADEEPAYEYGAEEQADGGAEASFEGEEEEMALDEEEELEPEPAPQPRSAARPRTSAGGTPLGQKYMMPVSQVKTTPPHIAEQLRQFAAGSSASSSSASAAGTPARVQPQSQQQQHETRTVSIPERHRLGRHSEPSSRNSPAVKKLLSQVGPAGTSSGSPAKGTPSRRSLQVAAERQLATVARAAPAPPTPKNAVREAVTFPSPRRRSPSFSSASSAVGYLASSISADVARLSKWALLALLGLYALWYRQESLAAGFCDSSPSSSVNTNALTSSRSLTGQSSLAFPSLPHLPPSILSTLDKTGLRPQCTPCPSHGVCSPLGLFTGCTADYVPRPSLLRTLTFGLVPAPPSCEADTEKQVAVAKQASVAARVLRRRKGEVMCERRVERGRRREAKALGLGELAGEEDVGKAEEAYVYGLEAEGVMKALVRENEASGAPFPEDVFDEISRLALRDLDTHGEVIVWQNGDTFWYASKTADMSLSCRAKLAAIRSAKKHKLSLFSIFSFLAAVLWARQKLRRRVEDKERVRQLVQAALRQLQQQERSHLSSPASFPYPHLAPSHLRDLLLTSVHSPSRRAELWRRVEKVVEGNANVRVGEVEVGGEEMRGWRWTGPTVIERDSERAGGEEGREMVQVGEGVVGTPSGKGKGTPVKGR